jgi:hypothetical protein
VKLKLEETGVKHTKGFNPHFDLDLKFGEKYQNELQEIFNNKKIEVKTDKICQRTGNVFVEIESRGKASGIMTTTADYWAFCLWKEDRKKQNWILIPTNRLKKIMVKFPIKNGGDYFTSKGHCVPKEELLTYEI